MPDPRFGSLNAELGLEGLCLSVTLSVVVVMARRLPRGSGGRQALAQAASPICEALDAIPDVYGGGRWVPRFTLRRRS